MDSHVSWSIEPGDIRGRSTDRVAGLARPGTASGDDLNRGCLIAARHRAVSRLPARSRGALPLPCDSGGKALARADRGARACARG